jgi:hypothetical protein
MDDTTNASNRRRSQRVVLQVAVLVRAEMPVGNRVQVQGFTLVVNAHGGLLESPLPVAVNQEIVLINPQTGKEVGCRVARAERTSPELVRVAFEFDEPTCKFWPISFPPKDWGAVAS